MKILSSKWLLAILSLAFIIFLCFKLSPLFQSDKKKLIQQKGIDGQGMHVPDTTGIPDTEEGELIRYGRDLIQHTALYLGPRGKVKRISNGMNCQNCHMNAGTVYFGNSFFGVVSSYPKYRDRSGMTESIEFRINECMERSMNGEKLDSLSKEMRAMLAYFAWLGKDVPKGTKLKGTGTEELPFLTRPADKNKGKTIYIAKCQVCHGVKGEGFLAADSASYTYPPLWGENSYTVSAGMYRLTKLAGFIRNNMPLNTKWQEPVLSIEESWDVAAYIASQEHPRKFFPNDWPNIATKPVDYPFGPYTDGFNERQHKYGPFGPIKIKKGN